MSLPKISKRLYRYLEPEWADNLCERGAIRIWNLEHFRRMEGPQADRLDGGSEYNSGNMFIMDPMIRRDEVSALAKAGVIIGNGARNITIDNLTVNLIVNGSALCFCDVPDNRHFLDGNKTSVVKIRNPNAFARTVTFLANGQLGGAYRLGRVIYDNNRVASGISHVQDPDPFKKREKFRAESEVRMFWPDARRPYVDIQSNDLKPFLTRLA